MSPAPKNKPAEAPEETAEAKRIRERKEAAQRSAASYKPRDEGDAAFQGSRGYVLAQFAIASEVDDQYQEVIKARGENREVLKSLFHQRLLTPDEAVLMFEVYPERAAPPNKKGQKASENGSQEAQDAAEAPAAA